MKHAFLILAHNQFDLLQILVDTIDDSRNDIYIHIDAKVKSLPELHTSFSGLSILSNRVDVRWGDDSVIAAELALFKTAASSGERYAYYHLISGVDLPLKNQDSFHDYFMAHEGKEFIGYSTTVLTPELVRKVQRWHMFPKHFRDGSIWQRGLRSVCLRLQEFVGWRRNRDVEFKKGANWVSVTDDFIRYVISREEWIKRTFHHTFCSDEIYLQTICWQSEFRDRLYNTSDEWKGNLRLIGWNNGCLNDWSAKDYDLLSKSDALFARKFNTSDMEFVRKVVELSK